MKAALHGDLGYAGKHVKGHHVTDHEHLGVSGEREVGLDHDAA